MSDQESTQLSVEDFVELDTTNLPYLKHIEVVNMSPANFGLERWQSKITLSDCCMRRIYKDSHYKDTDNPPPEPERLTAKQIKILNDEVAKNRRRDEASSSNMCYPSTTDNLLKILGSNNDKERMKTQTPKSDSTKPSAVDKLESCYKHKILSGNFIVRKALDKMKHLPAQEEKRYQELIRNDNFMNALNGLVEEYLKNRE